MNRHAPIALAALVLLAACEFAPVKREPPPLPFTGTKWMLVTERKLEKPPYLEFGDGAVTGFDVHPGRSVGNVAVFGDAVLFGALSHRKQGYRPAIAGVQRRRR